MNKNILALLLISLLFYSCGSKDADKKDIYIVTEPILSSQLEDSEVDSSEQSTTDLETINSELDSLLTNQDFICYLKVDIEEINADVITERTTIIDLYDKLQNDKLSKREELDLTELLVKYRLITKSHYFSPTLYTQDEIDKKIKETAKSYYKAYGLPSQCQYSYQYIDESDENAIAYGIASNTIESSVCLTEALKRIQVIPSLLVLTQAVVESGWGTSRFAREGNNLFGLQYTFSTEEELLSRPYCIQHQTDPTRCLFKFETLSDGIKTYYSTLNAGTYQTDFRDNRGALEINPNSYEDAIRMVDGLTQYAEESDYQETILNTMNSVNILSNNCE